MYNLLAGTRIRCQSIVQPIRRGQVLGTIEVEPEVQTPMEPETISEHDLILLLDCLINGQTIFDEKFVAEQEGLVAVRPVTSNLQVF
jgi:hypothetical protein